MPGPLSRRDFLAGGVLMCSAASATTIYLLPGGRASPSARLRLVTGADPTGARELLLNMWNRVNPNAAVEVHIVGGSTSDQRRAMIDAINNNRADIVNLDVIHIPYFADQGLLAKIELEDVRSFLEQTRRPGEVDGDPGRFWAAPFNTDVGMLFERLSNDRGESSNLGLAGAVDETFDG